MSGTLLRWYLDVPAVVWFSMVLFGAIAISVVVGDIRRDRRNGGAR